MDRSKSRPGGSRCGARASQPGCWSTPARTGARSAGCSIGAPSLDRRSHVPIDRAQPPSPAGWHHRVPAPASRSGPRRHPLIATGLAAIGAGHGGDDGEPTSVAGHSGCSQEFPPYVSKLLQSCVWTPGIARWVQYSVSGPRAAAHGNDFRRRRFHAHLLSLLQRIAWAMCTPPRRSRRLGAAAAPSVVDRAGHASGGPGHRRRPRQRAGAPYLDEPIQRGVEANRTTALNDVFLMVSRLGSTVFVLVAGTLGAILTWRRCRAVATALLVATFARPRSSSSSRGWSSRPARLRPAGCGHGYSFPGGHVMAAIALWGLLPVVVALYTRRRAIWWASVALSATLIAGISAMRVPRRPLVLRRDGWPGGGDVLPARGRQGPDPRPPSLPVPDAGGAGRAGPGGTGPSGAGGAAGEGASRRCGLVQRYVGASAAATVAVSGRWSEMLANRAKSGSP